MNKFKKFDDHLLQIAMKPPLILRIAEIISTNYRVTIRTQAKKKMQKKLSLNGDLKVLYGPFKGLIYPKIDSVGSVFLPKILGTYESELHHTLEKICETGYKTIIDIGAGEGYYAIGLLTRIPESVVFAFESNQQGQDLCKEMAKANHIEDRLTIYGECDVSRLKQLANEKKKGLILCDCEGCELDLLLPEKIPQLKYFDILAELHDHSCVGPTVTQIFHSRFCSTHTVEGINLRHRKPTQHIDFKGISPIEQSQILSERRKYSVGWVFLKAKVIS